MPTDLHYLSLDDVARRLKARTLSSVEVTRAMLDRIAKIDGDLKSYATVTSDRALADAAACDAESASGRLRGPLHGVPVAVKDLCNTASVPTAAGMAIHRRNIPDRDATVVARLKAAGAVILGKLQMTEGAFGARHPAIPAHQSLECSILDRRFVVGLGRGDGRGPLLTPRWDRTPAARSAFRRP